MKKQRITAVAAALILSSFGFNLNIKAEGVEINHLSPTNTLVRVTGDQNYLILPVKELFEDDARINVLVDG